MAAAPPAPPASEDEKNECGCDKSPRQPSRRITQTYSAISNGSSQCKGPAQVVEPGKFENTSHALHDKIQALAAQNAKLQQQNKELQEKLDQQQAQLQKYQLQTQQQKQEQEVETEGLENVRTHLEELYTELVQSRKENAKKNKTVMSTTREESTLAVLERTMIAIDIKLMKPEERESFAKKLDSTEHTTDKGEFAGHTIDPSSSSKSEPRISDLTCLTLSSFASGAPLLFHSKWGSAASGSNHNNSNHTPSKHSSNQRPKLPDCIPPAPKRVQSADYFAEDEPKHANTDVFTRPPLPARRISSGNELSAAMSDIPEEDKDQSNNTGSSRSNSRWDAVINDTTNHDTDKQQQDLKKDVAPVSLLQRVSWFLGGSSSHGQEANTAAELETLSHLFAGEDLNALNRWDDQITKSNLFLRRTSQQIHRMSDISLDMGDTTELAE